MNCKNCIHWDKCSKTNGKTRYYGETIASDNVEELCEWFISTADVVPKSEVEKIFEEIETCMKDFEDDDDGYLLKKCEFEFFMREIKEKYAEQKNG